jgi:hypothetical protein
MFHADFILGLSVTLNVEEACCSETSVHRPHDVTHQKKGGFRSFESVLSPDLVGDVFL